jgi:ABC-type tungstate transport system permease subunit
MDAVPIDLPLDLASEDDTGLPWGCLDEAFDQSRIVDGAWIVVGSNAANAVAQVADIDGEIVHVRPLPGPVSRHRELLHTAVA